MPFNPRNVIDLLFKIYGCYPSSVPSDEEIRLSDVIKEMLDSQISQQEFDLPPISTETTLRLLYDDGNYPSTSGLTNPPDSNKERKAENKDDTEDYSSSEDEDFDDQRPDVSFEYKEKAVMYWRKGHENEENRKRKRNQLEKRNRSFSSVKTLYKKVRNERELYSWEEIVLNRGRKKEKIAKINEVVMRIFYEKRDRDGGNVHDDDLRKWGIQAAKDIGFAEFKASVHWVQNLKKENNIVSRKVTKVVTRKQVEEESEIKKAAEDFVAKVREEMKIIGPENTYNSDQSGFQLEMHTGRTLATKGLKKVIAVAQSVNATTHSYTIQPTVNANGQLLEPLLLVFPEPSGKFGPLVSKTMFRAPNDHVVATRSGKCTTDVLKDWYENILKPKIKQTSLLLLDAYGGFNAATQGRKDDGSDNDDSDDDNEGTSIPIHIRRIPKHTTGLAQPLDILGFRPYKSFKRTISDSPEVTKSGFSLRVRDNIIKLQSLIFNQMCSPRYHSMFRYGWYKGGYLEEHPPVYQTPVEFCFNPTVLQNCEAGDCNSVAFIRCSWCTRQLCFQDFILNYHLCYEFVEL